MHRFSLLADHTFNLSLQSWAENEQLLIQTGIQNTSALALIHRGEDGIVVPRSYSNKPGFAEAARKLAAQGLPVHIRLTGGGVVPQSADIINLQLVYPVDVSHPLKVSDQHYLMLCGLLQKLFRSFGIDTAHQTVSGSFCDGRFNLAANGRKIAGTAQCWQRRPDEPNSYIVLSSAVILADHAKELTERANLLETALGSPTRYQPEKTTAVAHLSGATAAEVYTVLKNLVQQEEAFTVTPAGF